MTRVPRDVSGQALARALQLFGYQVTRQTGSHVRLTTMRKGEHHVTIPNHPALRMGTLSSVVRDVADHLGLSRDDVLDSLFG